MNCKKLFLCSLTFDTETFKLLMVGKSYNLISVIVKYQNESRNIFRFTKKDLLFSLTQPSPDKIECVLNKVISSNGSELSGIWMEGFEEGTLDFQNKGTKFTIKFEYTKGNHIFMTLNTAPHKISHVCSIRSPRLTLAEIVKIHKKNTETYNSELAELQRRNIKNDLDSLLAKIGGKNIISPGWIGTVNRL